MTSERFHVTTWPTDPERQAVGRALVLPGAYYTVDHPVLFWASQVLAGAGWQLTTMRWNLDEGGADGDSLAFVESAADVLEARAPSAERTLVLAKSLGTYAAGWASRRGYPGIWLTPVLTDASLREALLNSSNGGLLIGGSDDELWDCATARATGLEVLEIAGADHAIHVGSDWRASLAALHQVLESIEQFALTRI